MPPALHPLAQPPLSDPLYTSHHNYPPLPPSPSPPAQGRPNTAPEEPEEDATEAPPQEAEGKEKGETEPQSEAGEEEEDGDEDEDEDEDERQLLGEFEKELEGILLPSDRERLRSEVKAGMEQELENIIQEVGAALTPAAAASMATTGASSHRVAQRAEGPAACIWLFHPTEGGGEGGWRPGCGLGESMACRPAVPALTGYCRPRRSWTPMG